MIKYFKINILFHGRECVKAPVLFVAHGGGPLPLLGADNHQAMIEVMEKLQACLPKPKALIVISAHWEEDIFCINSGHKPELYYDYYNFPEEAYAIQYPALGEPNLAQKIQEYLEGLEISTKQNTERGFDHGVFVPLKMIYPKADIPIVQISLQKSLNPKQHIELGQALKTFREQGVMVIGSGMTTHNFAWFRGEVTPTITAKNETFHQALASILESDVLTHENRAEQLMAWEKMPYAREVHLREEHLLPLHVCYGAAQTQVDEVISFEIMGLETHCYYWH